MVIPAYNMLGYEYRILSSLLEIIPVELQWCFAVILPVAKEFNVWVFTKLLYKTTQGKTLPATLEGICTIGTFHMFILMIFLDSKVEPLTEYLIMICDCYPNIRSCKKIIRLHKQGRNMEAERNNELQCLVMEEILEVCVQMVYSASFVMAYFGPNSRILGNVGSGLWTFEKVHSLNDKLSNVGVFFAIDVVQGIILGLVLYHTCQLYLYETYLHLTRQYGTLICLTISLKLIVVR